MNHRMSLTVNTQDLAEVLAGLVKQAINFEAHPIAGEESYLIVFNGGY